MHRSCVDVLLLIQVDLHCCQAFTQLINTVHWFPRFCFVLCANLLSLERGLLVNFCRC